ncbi:MAG TPA: DUF4450 domain-containing protein [Bryobacteraceae bacterium]|nr:DUF4450 domain-containing protein [Bryobacteraceae bacterium]
MQLFSKLYIRILCLGMFCSFAIQAQRTNPAAAAIEATPGIYPNLAGHIARPLRYHPDNGDFVIENGLEFFNRPLYGGNTAFRVDGGDKPELVLYLPGRGGNLRLGTVMGGTAKWLKDADQITTRYRPGELIYEIRDSSLEKTAKLTVEVLAYADTEGVIVRVSAAGIAPGTQLFWVYGGVNGERGRRDGDIGTERVPISEYFQFKPNFANENTIKLGPEGFTLTSPAASIVGIVPAGARQHIAAAEAWNNPSALLQTEGASAKQPVVVGIVPLSASHAALLSLQKVDSAARAVTDSNDSSSHQASHLLPAFSRAGLPEQFARAEEHVSSLRSRVRIETPDPYLDAAVAALNVAADALWDTDAHAIMHGAVAYRSLYLGWRGPYSLDDLGWHDRARENFNRWLPRQNTSPIPATIPPLDSRSNLARNEAGLHSNGDLSHSHYDMNMVFIDALLRHLLWTGDVSFARQVWPALQRHLAWEKRLFRREYGPEKLPLYEAYASIWASDDLYYNGGGTAYASAYNLYANRMAARIAALVGADPSPYTKEADLIAKGMRQLLWMSDQGTFAEYKDIVGNQLLHPDYALWNFYHTIDEEAVSPREAWEMCAALEQHARPIPVTGPGVPNDRPYHVFSETDWMPYSWSINNVVMDEHMNTALALWQGGHAEEAFTLAKGSLLASMFMGITPGNVGSMDYLDVYRRESQSDFGDSAGTMSRAIVEGLFGIHPDALAGTLRVSPGFPESWNHARLEHPDLGVDFVRRGKEDTWTITQQGTRFRKLLLRVPAAASEVRDVRVNGQKAQWRVDPESAGRPLLEVTAQSGSRVTVRITWGGESVNAAWLSRAARGVRNGDFVRASRGAYQWWALVPKVVPSSKVAAAPVDWTGPAASGHMDSVDLSRAFNDRVTEIFKRGKYLSPRFSGVSLELPAQGVGAWAGHLYTLPVIDDSGLRQVAGEHGDKLDLPNGVYFQTPSASGTKNIAFTSQWRNYPPSITVPLEGRAAHAYFLMAGSTNFMQSRMENGEVLVTYADGTSARLSLRNPETWWPIEQDYFIDDYQFPFDGPLPPRVDLKTGKIRFLSLDTFKGKGKDVPGGAATILDLKLDPTRQLKSLTVRTVANDVVIGLMSATLERP